MYTVMISPKEGWEEIYRPPLWIHSRGPVSLPTWLDRPHTDKSFKCILQGHMIKIPEDKIRSFRGDRLQPLYSIKDSAGGGSSVRLRVNIQISYEKLGEVTGQIKGVQ